MDIARLPSLTALNGFVATDPGMTISVYAQATTDGDAVGGASRVAFMRRNVDQPR